MVFFKEKSIYYFIEIRHTAEFPLTGCVVIRELLKRKMKGFCI